MIKYNQIWCRLLIDKAFKIMKQKYVGIRLLKENQPIYIYGNSVIYGRILMTYPYH